MVFHKVLALLLSIHPYSAFQNIRQEKWIYIFDDGDDIDDAAIGVVEESDNNRNDEARAVDDVFVISEDSMSSTMEEETQNGIEMLVIHSHSNSRGRDLDDSPIVHDDNNNDDTSDNDRVNNNGGNTDNNLGIDILPNLQRPIEIIDNSDVADEAVVEVVVVVQLITTVNSVTTEDISSTVRSSDYAHYDYVDNEFDDAESNETQVTVPASSIIVSAPLPNQHHHEQQQPQQQQQQSIPYHHRQQQHQQQREHHQQQLQLVSLVPSLALSLPPSPRHQQPAYLQSPPRQLPYTRNGGSIINISVIDSSEVANTQTI